MREGGGRKVDENAARGERVGNTTGNEAQIREWATTSWATIRRGRGAEVEETALERSTRASSGQQVRCAGCRIAPVRPQSACTVIRHTGIGVVLCCSIPPANAAQLAARPHHDGEELGEGCVVVGGVGLEGTLVPSELSRFWLSARNSKEARVQELVQYLLKNLYLDFQGDITMEQVRQFLRQDDSREARRVLARILDEKGVDDLLLTLADCLREHLRTGINEEVVHTQLNLYADS